MIIKKNQLSLAVIRTLVAGAAVGFAGSVLAQSTQKVEKIEVTGSNIKRVDGESALPIAIYKREDIEKTGATSTADLLDKLQLNSGAVVNISNGVGDGLTPGFAGASLRGLGPNNTLVLLNGRRMANYAFQGAAVDVNSIPISAVERVEVLKDGASAVYGTDAIGGVINFILRKDYQGIEGSYYRTKPDRDGGENEKYTLTAGYGDLNKDRFNILISLDSEKSEGVAAKQRDFAKTGLRPDLDQVKTSGNAYPANIRTGNGRGNPTAATGCLPAKGSYFIIAESNRNCRYDYTSALDIYPPIERDSAVARGTFQLNADNQLYGEYTYSKNKATYLSSETPINDFSAAGDKPVIFPASSKWYPAPFRRPDGTLATPTGDLAVAWRGKDAGPRTDEAVSEQSRFVAGLKGAFGTWDYDTAFNHAESKVGDSYTNGYLSEVRTRAAILSGAVNVFTLNGQDAAGQAALNAAKILGEVRSSKGTVDSFDFKTSTDLMKMSSGALSMALGGEARKEKFDDRPAAVLSSGDVLGGGGNYPGATADRKVTALFAEFVAPISKEVEATFALRTDHYSDFGSSTNPKIGIRWTPDKTWLFRGSYNTGFRAPSLPDLYVARYNSNTADSHSDPERCFLPPNNFVQDTECDAQTINQVGGNRNLQPEKSRQAALGFVFEPQAGLSIGVDYFWIERKNSIGALGDNTLYDNYNKYKATKFVRFGRAANGACSNDFPGASTPANVPCAISTVVQIIENLGIYRNQGFDVSASSSHKTSFGNFKFGIEGTYVSKYEYQNEANGAFFNNAGNFTSDNGAISRWRHVLTANWTSGPWAATIFQNFVLGYRDDITGATAPRQVGNVETYDMQGIWNGYKGLTVVLGVKNLMDRDPPASRQGQSFQVGYDPRYGDALGRVLYGKIAYAFK